jgi:uncharacterized protein YPO0396
MKVARNIALLALCLLVLSVVVAGCGKEEPAVPAAPSETSGAPAPKPSGEAARVGEEASTAAAAAGARVSVAQERFSDSVAEQLDKLSAKIKDLQSTKVSVTGDALKNWNDTLADLSAALDSIQKQVRALDSVSAADWPEAQATVKAAIKSLQERCAEAAALLARQSVPAAPGT